MKQWCAPCELKALKTTAQEKFPLKKLNASSFMIENNTTNKIHPVLDPEGSISNSLFHVVVSHQKNISLKKNAEYHEIWSNQKQLKDLWKMVVEVFLSKCHYFYSFYKKVQKISFHLSIQFYLYIVPLNWKSKIKLVCDVFWPPFEGLTLTTRYESVSSLEEEKKKSISVVISRENAQLSTFLLKYLWHFSADREVRARI